MFTFALSRPTGGTAAPISQRLRDVVRCREAGELAILNQLVATKDGVGLHCYAPMQGRVLETALTLHIFQKYGLSHDPEWQDRMETFLMDRVSDVDVFLSTVAGSVLALSTRSSRLGTNSFGMNRLLSTLEYAKKRKHALLAMILAEVGAIPFQSMDSNPARFADEAVHLFSKLYLTAISIVRDKWRSTTEDTRKHMEFLAKAQGENGGWEQQSLITILSILALGPAHDSFDRGIRFLKSVARDDGGVAFTDNLNVWTTALAALALQRSRTIPESVFRRIADYIVARQSPNGGWAFSEDVNQTDTDTASQCLQVLIQLDPDRYAEPIERAQDYFLGLQRPDGGYPTYELAGDSEVTMTANIVLVQRLWLDRRPELREKIQAGLKFIRSRQKPDGTFERSWSLCETYSIFRVHLAFNGCGEVDDDPAATDETLQKSIAYLVDHQYDNGSWGQTVRQPGDALSTAYGLLSLALVRRKVPRESIELAEKYLISQQNPETGEFISVPDVVGPRPMVFDIPLLATIFSVWALSVAEEI